MGCSLRKTQRCIMTVVDFSPVALLLVIFSWSYWAFNFVLSLGLLREGHTLQGLLYVLFYHPIFIMCMWSYWAVCKSSPGYTLDMHKKRDEDEEDTVGLLAYDHNKDTIAMQSTEHQHQQQQFSPVPITVKRDGNRRFCQKCKLEKYDRTHHCSQCKKCVLKMDHHCPWINNCVGFQNYKAFYLFLLYASLYCAYVFATTLPPTIEQANGPMSILGVSINCALLIFISGVFGLFLIPFTCFHTRQLCKNRTTIEFYEKANYRLGGGSSRDIMRSKHFNPWDIGTRKNIEQVLGKGPLWHKLMPLGRPLGDGSSFPINNYAYDTLGTDDLEETHA